MDTRAGTPGHILGYTIRSRTRIYVSYLLPPCLELMVYIVQTIADIAVSYQHFKSGQPLFGGLTLMLVLLPPFLSFIFIITSKEQWSNPRHANRKRFLGYQLMSLLLFPIVAAYRFARRIFWAVEALFHDDDDKERMYCLAKSGECTTCELYHLIQAYAQAAPQIILQLYHMLSQDLFRDYDTTTVQSISLVFSAIDLAAITVTYQRFESQKLAGRAYPWAVPNQIEQQQQRFSAAARLQEESDRRRRESARKISDFPESNKIMENFKLRHSDPETSRHSTKSIPPSPSPAFDEVDKDDSIHPLIIVHQEPPQHDLETPTNSTDDEKIQTSPRLLKHLHKASMSSINLIEQYDMVPETPPPPLPPELLRTQYSVDHSNTSTSGRGRTRLSVAANRVSTFKDMLLFNAQLYIKEHVPRAPKMLIGRLEDQPASTDGRDIPPSPEPPQPPPPDETDFFIPRPCRVVNGIEQDDFAAKSVSFLGWFAFICMRMIALSTFCVFYTRAFFILIAVHYVLMLLCLSFESRFRDKLNRTLFYLLLAYVYIFVILEFRIKFKNIRFWYVGFFVVTMAENLVTTILWWTRAEFESWWFGFMYEWILYSGIIFSATLVVYYCILKPKDVVYLLDDDK